MTVCRCGGTWRPNSVKRLNLKADTNSVAITQNAANFSVYSMWRRVGVAEYRSHLELFGKLVSMRRIVTVVGISFHVSAKRETLTTRGACRSIVYDPRDKSLEALNIVFNFHAAAK